MKKGYMIVERSRVDQVLKEQGLGLTGAIDQSTAAEIGKILGVQGLIVGSVGNYKTISSTMFLPTAQHMAQWDCQLNLLPPLLP
jgi:hypothetical protein